MARQPSAHGDSAQVPWAGRELSPSGFEDDTGAADPALLALVADPDTSGAELIRALSQARLLVAIVATATEITQVAPGVHVDSSVDTALVTLTSPGGERALPAFTGVPALAAWDPQARPVPVTGVRAAQAAIEEACDVLALDVAGPVTKVLGSSMLWALAQGRPWLPAHQDPVVAEAVHSLLASAPEVLEHRLELGASGALGIELRMQPGLAREQVEAIVARLGAGLADDQVRIRLDGVAITIR